jgi:hypothetical protein
MTSQVLAQISGSENGTVLKIGHGEVEGFNVEDTTHVLVVGVDPREDQEVYQTVNRTQLGIDKGILLGTQESGYEFRPTESFAKYSHDQAHKRAYDALDQLLTGRGITE